MTAQELYQTFSIQTAEYAVRDNPEELARKIMESSNLATSQKSVVYSSGTSTVGVSQATNNGHVLYSY